MSLRPTGLVQGPRGLYVVIDDPDTDGVLLIPASFDHRLVVSRDDLAGFGELHPARAPDAIDARAYFGLDRPADDELCETCARAAPVETGDGEEIDDA